MYFLWIKLLASERDSFRRFGQRRLVALLKSRNLTTTARLSDLLLKKQCPPVLRQTIAQTFGHSRIPEAVEILTFSAREFDGGYYTDWVIRALQEIGVPSCREALKTIRGFSRISGGHAFRAFVESFLQPEDLGYLVDNFGWDPDTSGAGLVRLGAAGCEALSNMLLHHDWKNVKIASELLRAAGYQPKSVEKRVRSAAICQAWAEIVFEGGLRSRPLSS